MDLELVKASQRKRFADESVVDRVAELDAAWRQGERVGRREGACPWVVDEAAWLKLHGDELSRGQEGVEGELGGGEGVSRGGGNQLEIMPMC